MNIVKKSFLLYHNQSDIFDSLSNEDAGELIKLLFHYSEQLNEDGMLPTDKIRNPVVRMALIAIMSIIKKDYEEYQKKCLKNKEAAEKRWEGKDRK